MRPTLCKWILAWPLTSVLETDNIKAMYDGIKQAFGPAQNKTALLKSAIGELIRNRVQQIAQPRPQDTFPWLWRWKSAPGDEVADGPLVKH